MTSPTVLSPDAYLSHISRNAARMGDLASRDLDAAVPPCPGWDVREALTHTGEVYSHKVACMRTGRRPQSSEWSHGPGEGEHLLKWFGTRAEELLAELAERGPGTPAYTWYEPQQNVGFWYRRMAQETVVHRVDVESAFDEVTPVDDALAVDGVDEVLDWFLSYQADEVGPDGPGRGTVAVRTREHLWRVTLAPDDVVLERERGPAQALVTGDPSELLLWLWGRRPQAAVAVEGDRSAIDGMRARLQVVTQ
jgi:uncharacterized protein (TIGR03083 family)